MGLADDVSGRVIRAFELGRQHRMHEQEFAQRQEDRKLEREILQHRVRELGIQEKLLARQTAIQNAQLLENQPGAPSGIPQNVRDILPLPAETPHPEQPIPGVEELGVSGISLRPRTREQTQAETMGQFLLQKRLEQTFAPPIVAPAGASVIPRTGGPPIFTSKKEPTGDFERVFLPAYASKLGKTPETLSPEESIKAFSEFTTSKAGAGSVEQQEMRDWLAKNPGKGPADWTAHKAAITAGAAAQARLHGDPELEEARNITARALAEGDMTRIKDVTSLRGNERMILYARAKKINPNFNPAETDRKIKMLDYYANGKGANNLQSFNIFLEHGGQAAEAINQISLTQSKLLNKPLNWWRKNVSGNPAYVNLIGALEPVRKEFEGFLLGGRALYAEDRKSAETILSDDSSPAQIAAALKRMAHTAQARANEENYRYKKVIGKDMEDLYSPEAIAGAQKMGVAPATGKSSGATPTLVSPDGKTTLYLWPDGKYRAKKP